MTGEVPYSVHNDTGGDAEVLIFSTRLPESPVEKHEGFWP